MPVTVFQDIRARRLDIPPRTSAPQPPPVSDDFSNSLLSVVPALRAFSRSLCVDQPLSDDLVRETLLKAWSARQDYDPSGSLKSWAFSILHNVFHTHWLTASQSRTGRTPKGRPVSPHAELASDVRTIAQAMRSLPIPQKEALILIVASRMTYAEAASITGVPLGTVKSRVFRARAALITLTS